MTQLYFYNIQSCCARSERSGWPEKALPLGDRSELRISPSPIWERFYPIWERNLGTKFRNFPNFRIFLLFTRRPAAGLGRPDGRSTAGRSRAGIASTSTLYELRPGSRLWGGGWRGARWRGPPSSRCSTGRRPAAGLGRWWGGGRTTSVPCGPPPGGWLWLAAGGRHRPFHPHTSQRHIHSTAHILISQLHTHPPTHSPKFWAGTGPRF